MEKRVHRQSADGFVSHNFVKGFDTEASDSRAPNIMQLYENIRLVE